MASIPYESTKQKFYVLNRRRIFGIIYLVLGLFLIYIAFNGIDAKMISTLSLGGVGNIPISSRIGLIALGVIMIASCLLSWLVEIKERYILTLVGMNFAILIFATLFWGAAGKSIDLLGMIRDSIRLSTPIALGAMAGLWCERTGVVNIAIEGMMLTAAGIGFAISLYSQNMWFGLLAAVIASGCMAAIHAVLSIRFKVDQVISGTAINVLAVGVTGFVRRLFLLNNPYGAPGVFPYVFADKDSALSAIGLGAINDFIVKLPIIGYLLKLQPMVYTMFLLVILSHLVLNYTPWGLRTRSVGEHPRAADTLGINVFKMRYVNVIIAGLIAGLGGAWFSLETTGSFEDLMTNGKGYIALAALIFGKWNPIGAFLAALLFGFSDALQFKLQILEVKLPIVNTLIPYQFEGMLPYIVTMIALAGVIGRSIAPAADGKPYEKEG
ncbi:MAG: ABC transporter permease [Chloroflexota bacterium]